jgi:type II secretory pathway component GspD/PulD (secretin)
VVQSGETVVMGGLITSQETRTQNSVPFLSSIPFLGRFFQSEQIDDQKRNLLVFVTATILSDRGENLVPVSAGYRPERVASVAPLGRASGGQSDAIGATAADASQSRNGTPSVNLKAK